MPQIDLKQYVDEVAQKIEHRELDAAIDHCRHILGFYPRYLPVYRLLASASLEKGDYAHAAHFLQSLLSADPECADAWADLATLSDDLGELEQATWLMERAFEIEPGSAEIRERLRALYKRRDGIDRPRLKLTPGALGRMYAVGGFYRRAIYELQRLLESGMGLPPLHVAFLETVLAKAFWNADDMEAMAESVCQSLLEKLPNCLQANLIMGQILWSRGQAQEAENYLAIARALDPEGRAARDLFGDQSPIPFEHIQIPHLEPGKEVAVVEQQSTAAVPVEDTSWLDDVGEAFEAGIDLGTLSEPDAESGTPGWLEEWSAAEEPPAAEAESLPEPSADRGQVGQTAPLPAWMTDLEPDTMQGGAEESELPNWLTEGDSLEDEPADVEIEEVEPSPMASDVGDRQEGVEEEETAEGDAELPAWLEELASEAEPAEELEAVSEEEPPSLVEPTEPEVAAQEQAAIPDEPTGELSADDLPDWLRAFGETDMEETAEIEPAAVDSQTLDEELPDWMQVSASETEETGSEEEVEEDELPDWLRALGDTEQEIADLTFEEEEPTEIVAGPALNEEELPDWLRELRTQQPDLEEEEQDALEWMAEEDGEAEGEIEAIEEDELPEWLRELRDQEAENEPRPAEEEAPAAEPDAEVSRPADASDEVGALGDKELPDWLQALRAQDAAPTQESLEPEELAVEGELPDWIEEIEAEADSEIPAEALDEEELPDWLRELRAQEPALSEDTERQELTSLTDEETPDWLAEIQAEEELELPVEAVDEEELPDWLRELRAQEPGFLSSDDEAESAAVSDEEVEMPGWSVKDEADREAEPAPSPADEQVTEEDLPDWLHAVQGEEEESQVATPDLPEATPAELPRQAIEMPEPVEGMPAWLSELEAEIAGRPMPEAQEELPTLISEPADTMPAIAATGEIEAELPAEVEETPPTEGVPSAEVTEELGKGSTRLEAEAQEPEATIEAPGQPELGAELLAEVEETFFAEAGPSGEGSAKVEDEALTGEGAVEGQEPEAGLSVEAIEDVLPEAVPSDEIAEERIEAEVSKETPALPAEEPTEAQQSEAAAEVPSLSEQEAIAPEEALRADTEQAVETQESESAALPDVEPPTEEEQPVPQAGEVRAELEESISASDLEVVADREPEWVRDLEAPADTSEGQAPDLVPVEGAAAAPPAEAAETSIEESEAAPAPAEVTEAAERLTQARTHLEDGVLDEAASAYEQLVDSTSLQPELLQDLEQAIVAHPDHAALQRVLGDVYMRTGQLQEALQAYRQALRKLS
jgi:tetratricopeptide (TPR) repeat protein